MTTLPIWFSNLLHTSWNVFSGIVYEEPPFIGRGSLTVTYPFSILSIITECAACPSFTLTTSEFLFYRLVLTVHMILYQI